MGCSIHHVLPICWIGVESMGKVQCQLGTMRLTVTYRFLSHVVLDQFPSHAPYLHGVTWWILKLKLDLKFSSQDGSYRVLTTLLDWPKCPPMDPHLAWPGHDLWHHWDTGLYKMTSRAIGSSSWSSLVTFRLSRCWSSNLSYSLLISLHKCRSSLHPFHTTPVQPHRTTTYSSVVKTIRRI